MTDLIKEQGGPDFLKPITVSTYIDLQDNFSNEVPKHLVSGRVTGETTHKVQNSWWQALIGFLDVDLRRGMFPEELEKTIRDFIDKNDINREGEKVVSKKRSKKEIEEANDILKEVIKGRKNNE